MLVILGFLRIPHLGLDDSWLTAKVLNGYKSILPYISLSGLLRFEALFGHYMNTAGDWGVKHQFNQK